MADRSKYIHAEKLESFEVKLYAKNDKDEPQALAFLYPAMFEYFKSEIPGKKVLDVGCGDGHWCYEAAQYGAKSVDGFDIQEEMVELAKQTTSQFSTVNICVGDVMDMPYEDNVFDVAFSFFVTMILRLEACISHFKELYRVLAPGGKAVVVNFTRAGYEKIFLRSGSMQVMVEKKIDKKLMELTRYPSQVEINDAFQDITEIIQGCFTMNQNGQVERITDINKVTNGQVIWSKCHTLTFADYFYNEQFIQQQVKDAGLYIDKIEDFFTEDRRIAYNNSNSEIKLDKAITDTPPFVLYHLSKPCSIGVAKGGPGRA